MHNGQLKGVLRHIRNMVGAGQTRDLSDPDLIDRFVQDRDEAAFAAILERHGPLVLGVCRRSLRSEHHAEDACQATFLVFARKAASIRKRESLASWLHGVASRVARKLQADIKRRAARDVSVTDLIRPDTTNEISWREGLAVLDEELNRLPATYRASLVFCYLQGRTHEDAARELGCSLGALRGRLERGRECLRRRLVKRGVAIPAALVGTTLVSTQATAAVPATLAVVTVKAAVTFARGRTVEGIVTAPVVQLTEGVIKTMSVTKIKMLGMLGVALGMVCAGVLVGAARSEREEAVVRPALAGAPAVAVHPGDDEAGAATDHTTRVIIRDVAGKPVAGARVFWAAMIQPPLSGIAMPKGQQNDPELKCIADGKTDAQGKLDLHGRYGPRDFAAMMLMVQAPGYGMAGKRFGDDKNAIEVTLRPGLKITGQLLTPAGAPAKGVRVRLQSITSGMEEGVGLSRNDEKPPFDWPNNIVTDDQGRFTIGGFCDGADAQLTVSHDEFAVEDLYISSKPAARRGISCFRHQAAQARFPAYAVSGPAGPGRGHRGRQRQAGSWRDRRGHPLGPAWRHAVRGPD